MLPRLYDDLAWLWPHLSPPSHYVAEAELLDALIAERLGPGPKRILELGAGGGHTLVHLAAPGNQEVSSAADASNHGVKNSGGGGRHECVAVDLSEPMLANCRELIPGIETVVGDMRDVRLNQTFDVVLIHDAIDYLLTPDDVAKTLTTVREHLLPGGLAFVAPTYTRETFTDGDVANDATPGNNPAPGNDEENGDDEIPGVTYFSYVHDPDPGDDTFEMILLYLIRDRPRPRKGNTPRREVEVVEDRHTCGLFAATDWQRMMADAGLPAELIEQGDGDDPGAWSLFLGVAP